VAVALSGCASSTAYQPGTRNRLFTTQANADRIFYQGGGVTLLIEKLDHSTPTRTVGDAVAKNVTAIGAVGAAFGMGVKP
jgi:hypothetical protein